MARQTVAWIAAFITLIAGDAAAQIPTPCGVPAIPDMRVQTANSMIHPQFGPIIVFNPAFFQQYPLLFRWMLAHECAHHQNGDMVSAMTGPGGYMLNQPAIELKADCVSARTLRSVGDTQSLTYAIQFWAAFGNRPTGLNYPTGFERADALSHAGPC